MDTKSDECTFWDKRLLQIGLELVCQSLQLPKQSAKHCPKSTKGLHSMTSSDLLGRVFFSNCNNRDSFRFFPVGSGVADLPPASGWKAQAHSWVLKSWGLSCLLWHWSTWSGFRCTRSARGLPGSFNWDANKNHKKYVERKLTSSSNACCAPGPPPPGDE